jgi:prepilin-type N-terminal cleavage/methylation domain-containing protein
MRTRTREGQRWDARAAGRGGFSLTELLIVAALVAIIALVALPNLLGRMPADRVEQAQWELLTDLRRARTDAIGRSAWVTVTFDAEGRQYTVDTLNPDGSTQSRSERITAGGVSLRVTRTRCTFGPTGLLSDSSHVLIAWVSHPRGGSRYVIVLPSGLVDHSVQPLGIASSSGGAGS